MCSLARNLLAYGPGVCHFWVSVGKLLSQLKGWDGWLGWLRGRRHKDYHGGEGRGGGGGG